MRSSLYDTDTDTRRERDAPRRQRRQPDRRYVPAPRGRPRSTPRVLRQVGAAILVGGWFAAAIVLTCVPAAPDTDAVAYDIIGDRVFPISLAESRRQKREVARLEGNMGVWIAEFDSGLDRIERPPALGWTLLALSTALGVGLLRLAALSEEDDR